ncbi:hypothetical protein VPH35_120079 [Triticum aestivum]
MVQKKNFHPKKFKNNKNKTQGKGKFDTKNKPSHSTNFKKNSHKKGKGLCHVCGDPNHWAPKCPNRFEEREHDKSGKSANVVIGDTDMKESGYGHWDFSHADGERVTCHRSRCWYGRSEVYFGEDRASEERSSCAVHQ